MNSGREGRGRSNGYTGPGEAKAWVKWVANTGYTNGAAVNASYNVLGVFRNGTGDYTIEFNGKFVTTRSVPVCFAGSSGGSPCVGSESASDPGVPGKKRIVFTIASTAVLADPNVMYCVIFGDL